MSIMILKRLAQSCLILVGVSIVSFSILKFTPGDPISFVVPNYLSLEENEKEEIRERLGLNQPVYIQFFAWFKNLLNGQCGTSLIDGQPVMEKINAHVFASLELLTFSIILALFFSVTLGLLSVYMPYSRVINFLVSIFYTISSAPAFFLGLILIYIFSVELKWLPVSGQRSWNYFNMGSVEYISDLAKHIILPVITLGLGNGLVAELLRFMKVEAYETIEQDYIRTAWAKGVSPAKVLFKHIFKNASIPFFTILLFRIPTLIGGAVVVEKIFAWPGLGRLIIDSIFQRDYPVIMMVNFFMAVIVVIFNFIGDLLILKLDPRIRSNLGY